MIASAVIGVPLLVAALCSVRAATPFARTLVVAASVGVAVLGAFGPSMERGLTAARVAWAPQIGAAYIVDVDGLSAPFLALTGIVFAVAAVATGRVGRRRAYCALLALALAGAGTVFVARDLALFLVGWETTLLALATLAWQWGAADRRGAALRYVLYGLCGDALLVVGIASLAVARGTLDIDALAARRVPAGAQLFPAMLLLAGLAVRLPAFPFHAWLPRVARAAPPPVLAVVVGVGAAMAAYGVLRLPLYLFPQGMAAAAPFLVALAAVGALYGALLAIRQDDLRLVIAFTSLSQSGLIVLALVAATAASLRGAMLMALAQGAIVTVLYVLASMVAGRTSSFLVTRAGGLTSSSPGLAAAFAFAVFAGAGLPGTITFAGMLLGLAGAYERFPAATAAAAVAIVLGTVAAVRAMRAAFYGPPLAAGPDLAWRERLVVAPLLVLIVAIGVVPRAITDRVPDAALPTAEGTR